MAEAAAASGPDLTAGIPLDQCAEGQTISARVGDEPVLLSRFDGEFYAIGATCTHYGGALGEGLNHAGTVRCPLHHACFDLKTGAALRAPALDPVDRWRVDVEGNTLFVREKLDSPAPATPAPTAAGTVVIVGGGAAAVACANDLRRLGHDGEIIMLSADQDPPCDRPNLSKDYLAGNALEEWIPLRSDDWYRELRIDLRLETEVCAIDLAERLVVCKSGERVHYDRLLLATGAEPRRLDGPGFDGENVVTLRSLADARALIERATPHSRAAIVGSSFIGLEAAAALRHRKVEVDVIAPESVPFDRVLGKDVGGFIRKLHEDNGVRFHLGTVAASLNGEKLSLANGETVLADFVLLAVGVAPKTTLAQAAGLQVENGVVVDAYLETSAPGIYAAGDIAAYPDPLSGGRVRIEHWAVAEHQGQTAAANMLGLRRPFRAIPFFWTEQYGQSIRYTGHASGWDEARVGGEIGGESFHVRYYSGGRHLASAWLNRNHENLEDELKFEETVASA
jgi:NADPH-dependent 2,4-dienoyl-CoA reductase/sulfur reductase-like enzyme/nitrite reductase/ring-hydroxylating ferredoxin subunit